MTILRTCVVAAVVQLACVAATQGQTWVDLRELSVEGRGKGDGCVKDATASAKPLAWQRALADMSLSASEPLAQCAQAKADRFLEITAQKRGVVRTGDDRCQVPFSLRYQRTLAAEVVRRDCLQASDGVPVGIVFRAERREPGAQGARPDEGIADAARAGMESWLAKSGLRLVSLPEYQDAFVSLKTSMGECAIVGGASATQCETVFGSPAEARKVLSRMLSDVLDSSTTQPNLLRWRDCGGLLGVGTVTVASRADDKGFSEVRGTIHVTYFALSRDLTLIASDHDERPLRVFDSNGGYDEAVRTVVSTMVGAVGPKLAQKLSTFTHTDGCTAR